MKKLFTVLAVVLLTASVFAQAPGKMSYQAVIRNRGNVLVTSTTVGMQISILQGSVSGTVVYTETQTPTTNANGLVSIEIGGATGFNTIDWANGPYFIETETDPTGGTTYTITGTSQLLSVPYALHSKSAETLTGGITETDPIWTASPSFGITNTKISNWNTAFGWGNHAAAGYLTSFTETDPLFVASPANGITNTNIANWATAYSWGNHATAGYLTSFTETDPIFVASPANGITGTNITNWNTAYGWGNHAGLYRLISWVPAWTDVTGKPTFATVATSGSYTDLINKPTTDGSETKVTAGTNVTVTGSGTTANPYMVNATGNPTLTIGQSYQGGIIFWLDATGQHGLIAAATDQSTGIQWLNGTYRYTGSTGDGLYAGAMNTAMIVATQMADNQTGNFAAKVCADYSVTVGSVTYGDWYLPSKYELNLMYLNIGYGAAFPNTNVGGFAYNNYCSSTETSNSAAWFQYFGNGTQNNYSKLDAHYVRAVRAF